MKYWLMKSEPDVFGIKDLENKGGKTEPWDGIRNYQARNFILEMSPGDAAFFYHSNCPLPGIAGIMEIAGKPRPDDTAFDRKSGYFDPKSSKDNPRWYLVDVSFRRRLKRVISLSEIRTHKPLSGLKLLHNSRLSVMPVSKREWEYILTLE